MFLSVFCLCWGGSPTLPLRSASYKVYILPTLAVFVVPQSEIDEDIKQLLLQGVLKKVPFYCVMVFILFVCSSLCAVLSVL